MSNKHYRTQSSDHDDVIARVNRAYESREAMSAEDIAKAQSATESLLRGFDDPRVRKADEAFRESLAQDGAKEDAGTPLSDGDVLEMLEQQARMLAAISNNAMFAIQAVGPENADRAFARDLAERTAKPELPARAHPLMSMCHLITRCTRNMMQIFALTRPHLFAAAKAKVHAAVNQIDKLKAEAKEAIREARGGKMAATPAAS